MALLVNKDIFGISNQEPFVFGKRSNYDVFLNTEEDLKFFCEVYALDVPQFPGYPWNNMAQNLGLKKVKWSQFIPADKFDEILYSYFNKLFEEIKTKTKDKLWYFSKIIPIEKRVLNSFASICYSDGTEKEHYLYKRTAVGRLVSTNNINLFQMSYERRKQVLDTRFSEGKIISLDFKALEPRTMLAISNPEALKDCDDVYSKVIEMTNLVVTRDVIKATLLRILNGSSIAALMRDYDLEENLLLELQQKIFELFKYNEIVEMLKKQYEDYGRIFTYFGRPLVVSELNEKLFFTYYMQGTSADVCLIGFDQINTAIQNKNLGSKIKPIAMIYDSFILDMNLVYQSVIDETLPKNVLIRLNNEIIQFPLAKSEF